VVLRWLGARLRYRFGAIKKEDCDLPVRLLSDVDCTMWAITRLAPIYLAGCDFDALGFATIPEFDCQRLATHDHGYPLERIAVPWRRLAGREAQPPNELVFVMMQHVVGHCSVSSST
jgi:hypothetical protein